MKAKDSFLSTLLLFFASCLAGGLHAQGDLEVEGTVHIATMDLDDQVDSVVVRTSAGLLAVRDVSTLAYGPWHLGLDTMGGIVYHLYRDQSGDICGLLVSQTEGASKWQDVPSSTSGDLTYDGKSNTDLMTDSPAKDWIAANLPSGWYLPAIDELSLLWQNRLNVAKALDEGGYTGMSTSYYWSSTENSAFYAWLFDFETGTASKNAVSKTNAKRIRAVKAF